MSVFKIDIVSDVVCPWCIVGYKQLEQALERTNTEAEIHWHPFELNPKMPPEGQNLVEHVAQKYGTSAEQSAQTRERFSELGDSLGFDFVYSDESRIVNTFKAHQLLHWAGLQGVEQEHRLKLALFEAYFSNQQDVSDEAVLLATVIVAELDAAEAQSVLEDARFELDIRKRQQLWASREITGVPAMIFSEKYLVSGAQGVENYISVIEQVQQETASS